MTLHGSEIRYGAFLTVIVNFLLLALVLFGLVKLLKRTGLGNFRAQGSHECPFCKEFVAIDATKCKWCTARHRAGPVSTTTGVARDHASPSAGRRVGT